MSHELAPIPTPRKLQEIYGLTEHENLFLRVSEERFQEIIQDERTLIHSILESSNDFGEFLFVTTSRPGDQSRIAVTFYGQGYHENRERWISDEWFWYEANANPEKMRQTIEKQKGLERIQKHLECIQTYIQKDTQTDRGRLFETLADLTDEDGALTEMEDLESLNGWLAELDQHTPPEEPPPTGEYLLDQKTRKKLPPLNSGEEMGLDALAHVKFFTPDSNWTWYASEFDGEDIFFGLVSGFEIELGYFSLKELQEAFGPHGLPIERDQRFEPRTLKELMEIHRQGRSSKTDGISYH